jgi:hypothetical protein
VWYTPSALPTHAKHIDCDRWCDFCARLAKQWWVGGRAVGRLYVERGARVCG